MPVIMQGTDAGHRVVVVREAVNTAAVKESTHVVQVGSTGVQGPKGAVGPIGPDGGSAVALPTNQPLGGHRLVRSDANGFAVYVDAANAQHGDDTVGFTTGAAQAGDAAAVQRGGALEFNGWSFTPEQPVFAALNGLLTQVPPAAASGFAFSQVVGFAATSTRLMIDIQPAIYF